MKPYETALIAVGKGVASMTGSRLMHDGEDKLIISGIKASRKYSRVTITYDAGADLFNMEFTAKRSKKTEVIEGLYVDMLREQFETKTGLYTSL